MKNNPSLRADTMRALQTLLNVHHRYAAIYKQAREILAEYPDADNASIRLRVDPSHDQRRYNLPTVDEVAIIIPGDGEQATDGRDIILRNHQNSLQWVSDGHSAYDCLRYVLLFPYGEHGWHYDSQSLSSTSPKVSQSRYYAYRLHSRLNEFSTILHGRRLFQEFLVDKFAGIDQNRLRYLVLRTLSMLPMKVLTSISWADMSSFHHHILEAHAICISIFRMQWQLCDTFGRWTSL
jgi:hypothetical protein